MMASPVPRLTIIGVFLAFAAVAVAILNLHRVANLGMPWLAPLLTVFGAVCVIVAAKQSRK